MRSVQIVVCDTTVLPPKVMLRKRVVGCCVVVTRVRMSGLGGDALLLHGQGTRQLATSASGAQMLP
jgi:hypothetical protein